MVELTPLDDGSGFDHIITDRAETLQVRATAGDAALPPVTIPWVVIPRLTSAEVVTGFPAYTGLPPLKAQGGDVKAVEGS